MHQDKPSIMPEQTLSKQHNFKRLLIIMTDRHIGNLLVSLYAIKRVNQQLTQDQTLCCVIDFHLLPLASYLLPDVEFIACTIRGARLSIFKKLLLFITMLFKVRRKKIDTAVDLYGHGESYTIARLSGARFITAFSCRPNIQKKYNWTSANTKLQPKHQIDFYLYPFIPLLGSINSASLNAPKYENTLATVKQKLIDLGIASNQPLVIIHPGAGKDYKLWPIKHWQALIEKLEQTGRQVLLIGAGVDKVQVDAILASSTISPTNGYQQFNLIETIHLGFIAHCMIGNDSGPTHLMATTPTTVFSLFGPTDYRLWSPLSANSHILKSDTACLDACSKQVCQREVSCLENLSPTQVFEAIERKGGLL